MPYATADNLTVRFGPDEMLAIADRDGDAVIDADVVAAALAKASTLIDSYIGARYALPLPSTPAVLKGICEDLARYDLYTVEPTQIVRDNRDAAIALLKDISRGLATLDVPAPAAADPASSGVQILFDGGDRGVSRAELRKL